MALKRFYEPQKALESHYITIIWNSDFIWRIGGRNILKEEIIKPGIVRRIVEKVENDNGMIVSPETADTILTAFLDTVTDVLSEGDIIKLNLCIG